MTRGVNQASIILLEKLEDLYLKAYLDQSGVPTIGWGHTAGVSIADTCTRQQAEIWLEQDLTDAENAVERLVKIKLGDNQFGALVLFTFNEGQGNLATSTLLRKLNTGDYASVASEMPRFNKYWSKDSQSYVTSLGLVRRRKAEVNLWNTSDTVGQA